MLSRVFLRILLTIAISHALPRIALAQCSMCRDTTAGSAPQVRSGLRKAIPVLGIPAVVVFSGILFIAIRRNGGGKNDE